MYVDRYEIVLVVDVFEMKFIECDFEFFWNVGVKTFRYSFDVGDFVWVACSKGFVLSLGDVYVLDIFIECKEVNDL